MRLLRTSNSQLNVLHYPSRDSLPAVTAGNYFIFLVHSRPLPVDFQNVLYALALTFQALVLSM